MRTKSYIELEENYLIDNPYKGKWEFFLFCSKVIPYQTPKRKQWKYRRRKYIDSIVGSTKKECEEKLVNFTTKRNVVLIENKEPK